jgi:hypothetical protein
MYGYLFKSFVLGNQREKDREILFSLPQSITNTKVFHYVMNNISYHSDYLNLTDLRLNSLKNKEKARGN